MKYNTPEELIAAYNSNISENIETIEYISKRNIFDMTNKSRNEMTHSSFIAELLGGQYFSSKAESSIIHFLDAVVRRATSQGIIIDNNLKEAIITRKLRLSEVENKKVELTLSKYAKAASVNMAHTSKENDRLDIYLKYNISEECSIPKEGNTNRTSDLELFIENKVFSSEGDCQTQSYYDTCCKNNKGTAPFKLFIYLTPISNKELGDKEYTDIESAPKARFKGNPVFVFLNYQDILDYVIEPLMLDSDVSEKDKFRLEEYINCLELPGKLPDTDINNENQSSWSIMATSKAARQLFDAFMTNSINSQLMELAINVKLGNQLYDGLGEKAVTYGRMMERIVETSEGSVVEIIMKNSVTQRGLQNQPLIYSIDGEKSLIAPLYLYRECLYSDQTSLIVAAIKDFQEKKNLSDQDTILAFSKVISNSKAPLLSAQQCVDYLEIYSGSMYVRKLTLSDKQIQIFNTVVDENIFSTEVSDEQLKRAIESGNMTIFKDKETVNGEYVRIGNTHYYYNSDEKRCNLLFKDKDIQASQIDKKVVESFYENHKALILSMFKVKMENSENNILYNQTNFNKLLKIEKS